MLASRDDHFDLGPLVSLPDEQLGSLLATTFRAVGLSLDSTSRPPDTIIERLIRKLRRGDPEPRIEQALSILERLGEARGQADEALDRAGSLLEEHGVSSTSLEELRAIVDLVVGQGIEADRLIVDLGLGRGLHYYSGMIFEIESPDGVQLAGGGRYDELVGALGSRSAERLNIPAVGFAYGLERVSLFSTAAEPDAGPLALVAAVDDAYPLAMRVADALRDQGFRVLLDARGRSNQANLRDAERRGCSALIVLSEPHDDGTVMWYDVMASPSGSGRPLPVSDILQGSVGLAFPRP